MTRDEFEFHMEHNCFSHAAKDLRAHDQAQREEIARLRQALRGLISAISLPNDAMRVFTKWVDEYPFREGQLMMVRQAILAAEAALAKEATRDNAE